MPAYRSGHSVRHQTGRRLAQLGLPSQLRGIAGLFRKLLVQLAERSLPLDELVIGGWRLLKLTEELAEAKRLAGDGILLNRQPHVESASVTYSKLMKPLPQSAGPGKYVDNRNLPRPSGHATSPRRTTEQDYQG
jgi:hypothetical protein